MRRPTLAAAALVGAALVASPVLAAPANAHTGIEVRHYSPDSGFVRDLAVHCGTQGFRILEGRSSVDFHNVTLGADCHGVTSIFVVSGTEWWRQHADGTADKSWDVTGWHNLPAGWSDGVGITIRQD